MKTLLGFVLFRFKKTILVYNIFIVSLVFNSFVEVSQKKNVNYRLPVKLI